MERYCIAMTTVENEAQAGPLIDRVLQERLAACIQTYETKSHYRWEGEICHDSEVLIVFKTTYGCLDGLRELLERVHPYDVPEFLVVPVRDGSAAYLKWIDDSVGEND